METVKGQEGESKPAQTEWRAGLDNHAICRGDGSRKKPRGVGSVGLPGQQLWGTVVSPDP